MESDTEKRRRYTSAVTTVGGSNNEKLTDVCMNEVVAILSALVSLSVLLPLGIIICLTVVTALVYLLLLSAKGKPCSFMQFTIFLLQVTRESKSPENPNHYYKSYKNSYQYCKSPENPDHYYKSYKNPY